MNLRVQANTFGSPYMCVDDDTYDGAPDAGPQLIGRGDTEEESIHDYLDQLEQRTARLA